MQIRELTNWHSLSFYGKLADVPQPLKKGDNLYVDGRIEQTVPLGDTILSVPRIISYISGFTPLGPGDVIAIRSPAGAARVPQRFIKAGEIVEICIDGVGTLGNPVIPAPL